MEHGDECDGDGAARYGAHDHRNGGGGGGSNYPPLGSEFGRTDGGALINNPPYFKQTLSTYANTKYVCGAEQGRGT